LDEVENNVSEYESEEDVSEEVYETEQNSSFESSKLQSEITAKVYKSDRTALSVSKDLNSSERILV
jgi:hypothetical protein